MTENSEPPDFECPFCKSMVQQKNLSKHMLKLHQDSTTIARKYVICTICEGLFLKNKLTPHMRKAHQTVPGKNQQAKKPAL